MRITARSAARGGEEAVGDVDGDALLALGRQAVDQQREVELAAARTELARIGGELRQLVIEHHLRFVQQSADEGRLAVVHRAAGDEAQQALALVRAQARADIRGERGGRGGHQK
jgi:hypothetical protein